MGSGIRAVRLALKHPSGTQFKLHNVTLTPQGRAAEELPFRRCVRNADHAEIVVCLGQQLAGEQAGYSEPRTSPRRSTAEIEKAIESADGVDFGTGRNQDRFARAIEAKTGDAIAEAHVNPV